MDTQGMVSSASESTSWIAAALQIQQLSGVSNGATWLIDGVSDAKWPRRRSWRKRHCFPDPMVCRRGECSPPVVVAPLCCRGTREEKERYYYRYWVQTELLLEALGEEDGTKEREKRLVRKKWCLKCGPHVLTQPIVQVNEPRQRKPPSNTAERESFCLFGPGPVTRTDNLFGHLLLAPPSPDT
uniref:Uncharacterized protein n=1 Tax=Oryza sativa subsp. japonica TaxID=39947 RepID=Q6K2D9_ORYSJ|nr:hypothetical protein [Oryza sativa Japonica Group]